MAPSLAAWFVGKSVNAQGNELALTKQEPGRIFGSRRGSGRPDGLSSARFATGVNPLPSITGDLYLPRA